MWCIRMGNFGSKEFHKCFQCGEIFSPGKQITCEICNWKKCEKGHCGCTVSKETKEAMEDFYNLFCRENNYSSETKKALLIMLRTFNTYCRGSLQWKK